MKIMIKKYLTLAKLLFFVILINLLFNIKFIKTEITHNFEMVIL